MFTCRKEQFEIEKNSSGNILQDLKDMMELLKPTPRVFLCHPNVYNKIVAEYADQIPSYVVLYRLSSIEEDKIYEVVDETLRDMLLSGGTQPDCSRLIPYNLGGLK